MAVDSAIREKILDHGLGVASVQGLHAVTMGEVARELQVPRSGLFTMFATKEKLQLAILEQAATRFVATVITPTKKLPQGLERVEALFRNWISWATSDALIGGCPFLSASAQSDTLDAQICRRLNEVLDGWRAELLDAIRDAQGIEGSAGLRADLDAQQFVFELFGLYLSHHYWYRSMHDAQAEQRTLKSFERLMNDARAA